MAENEKGLLSQENLILLIPLLFASGCLFYFFFPSGFTLYLPAFIGCFVASIPLIFWNRNSQKSLLFLAISLFLAGGFYALGYEKIALNYQKINGKIYVVGEGKITHISKFHNPKNNTDGLNFLIAPFSLRKPQNTETAKFFRPNPDLLTNSPQNFDNPLNQKFFDDSENVTKTTKANKFNKKTSKKKHHKKKGKAKKTKKKCPKQSAIEIDNSKHITNSLLNLDSSESVKPKRKKRSRKKPTELSEEGNFNSADLNDPLLTKTFDSELLDHSLSKDNCSKKPRKKRKSKKQLRNHIAESELAGPMPNLTQETESPKNKNLVAEPEFTSTETNLSQAQIQRNLNLDKHNEMGPINEKNLDNKSPSKVKRERKKKSVKVNKIADASAKKFFSGFVNIPNFTEIDREFLDFKNSPQNIEWKESGDIKIMKSLPPLISLNLIGDFGQLQVDDVISFYALINSPKNREFTEDFDFALDAKMKGIGGFGFFIGVPQIIPKTDGASRNSAPNLAQEKTFSSHENLVGKASNLLEGQEKKFGISPASLNFLDSPFLSLRSAIEKKIKKSMEGDVAGVAIALLIGDQKQISQPAIINIRNSGLAHLLSISGFHLSLASAIFFVAIRYGMSRNEKLALKFNLKKIAAVFAILASYFYLKIAGSPIPAQRAFAIVLILMMGILIDRKFHNLRALSFAFLTIILLNPLMLFSISFQLSFVAVLVLIIYYNDLRQKIFSDAKLELEKRFITGLLSKSWQYLAEIILLSFLIQLASLPFLMHNFRNIALLGFAANIVAIPLASFFIMPLGFLSLFLMPISGEFLALKPMEFGIELLLKVTDFIGKFELSKFTTPHLPTEGLAVAIVGFLLFCLGANKISKILGTIIFSLSFATIGLQSKPSVIFDSNQKFFAIYEKEGGLFFSKKLHNSKRIRGWMNHFDESEFKIIKNCGNYSNKGENDIILPDSTFDIANIVKTQKSISKPKSKKKVANRSSNKAAEDDDFETMALEELILSEAGGLELRRNEQNLASEKIKESKSCLKCNESLCLLSHEHSKILIITKRNQVSKLCSPDFLGKFDAIVNLSGKYQLPKCVRDAGIEVIIDNFDFLQKDNPTILLEEYMKPKN